jgi:hypothetical protein
MSCFILRDCPVWQRRASTCLSAWGRSARPQMEALRCHAGHGLNYPVRYEKSLISIGVVLEKLRVAPSGQEILRLLLNLKVIYCLDRSSLLDSILNQSTSKPTHSVPWRSFQYSRTYAAVTQLIFFHVFRIESRSRCRESFYRISVVFLSPSTRILDLVTSNGS